MFRGRERRRADKIGVLGAAIFVAQTQLLAQVADDASLDGRSTGLVGFNAALVAATIASKELLGDYWWVPLPALGVSTVVLVVTLFGRLESLLTKNEGALDLGKTAVAFFEQFGGRPRVRALEQLLADLGAAFDANAKQISAKRRRLQAAIAVLLAGLTVAAVLIAVHRPTTLRPCQSSRVPLANTSEQVARSKNSGASTGCTP